MSKSITDTEQPLYSIVTITKDNLSGLKSTEESVKAQTLSNYEWVVIDGNSDDGTKEYLESINAKYISEDDRGIYDAMNKAIPLVNGRYTIFMNAGDRFAHADVLDKIRITPNYLPNMIYGDALEQCGQNPEDNIFKAAKSHKQIHRGLFTHHQAIFYKTKFLREMSYNTMYKLAADYDLTLRFLKQHPDAYYVTQPICIFEAGGVSQSNDKRGRIEQQVIRRKELGYSWFNNKSVALTQRLASAIKKRMPPVYWWIRTHTPKAKSIPTS